MIHSQQDRVQRLNPPLNFVPPSRSCDEGVTEFEVDKVSPTATENDDSHKSGREVEALNARFNTLSQKRAEVHASLLRARSLEPRARVRFQDEPRALSAGTKDSTIHRLRPVSISSDQCQYSSPPSSSGTAPSIRNAPTGVLSQEATPLSPSVASSIDRGRPSAGRTLTSTAAAFSPAAQMEVPISYKVERGARVPIYAEPPPTLKEEANLAPVVDTAGTDPPAAVYTLKAAFPPSYCSDQGGIEEDPDFPKEEEDMQCCECGVQVSIDDNPFVCKGFIGDGSTRCLHVVFKLCTACSLL